MSELPIGQPESQTLEFKQRESLGKPHWIAREVAAMLNTDGGTVWVGIPESGSVGMSPDSEDLLTNAPSRAASLLDYLIDRIEPPFRSGEVTARAVLVDSNRGVVRIDVNVDRVSGRGPFAYVHDGRRGFDVRVGNRLRRMTREELERAFTLACGCDHTAASSRDPGPWSFLEDVRQDEVPSSETSTIAFAIEDHERSIRITESQRDAWPSLIAGARVDWDPHRSWSILNVNFEPVVSKENVLSAKSTWDERFELDAYAGGALVARMPTEHFTGRDGTSDDRDARLVLHPSALIGAIVSFLELLGPWLELLQVETGYGLLDIALRAQHRIDLRRGSVHDWLGFDRSERQYSHRSSIWTDAHRSRLSIERLGESPHETSREVLAGLYESFGFDRFAIPAELQPGGGMIQLY